MRKNNKKKTTSRTIFVPTTDDPFEEQAQKVLSNSTMPLMNSIINSLDSDVFGSSGLSTSESLLANKQIDSASDIGLGRVSIPNKSKLKRQMIRSKPTFPMHSVKSTLCSSYQEISDMVDSVLLKKQRLDPLETSLKGNKISLANFYLKMIQIADKISKNNDFTVFTYNSGTSGLKLRTLELLDLLENNLEEIGILECLVDCLNETRLENSFKIKLLPILINNGFKIDNPKLIIDENIFEMAYEKITKNLTIECNNIEKIEKLCTDFDLMLFNLYTNGYDQNAGKVISSIINKIGFPKPIYKQMNTTTYLSTSNAETQFYGDYLVIVFSAFLLCNCVDFLGIYLAMERNVDFITKIVNRISDKSCGLVLKQIDSDYQQHLLQKLGALLFHKQWAKYSDISQVLHDVIYSEHLSRDLKIEFYSNCANYLYDKTKYRANLEDTFYMLSKSTDGQLLVGVRDKLQEQPVYGLFDRFVVKSLERISGETRHRVLTSLLIRPETLPLLHSSTKISFDPDNVDSIPNLLNISQTLVKQRLFLIKDTGEVIPNKQIENTTIYNNKQRKVIVYPLCQIEDD